MSRNSILHTITWTFEKLFLKNNYYSYNLIVWSLKEVGGLLYCKFTSTFKFSFNV